ncbi:MAG: FG-GAP repeat protein [Phycisphaerae bacterium]|nr:FG-GAP repeat protein [Phycisphaerae bacterium]MDD5380641.1 FG-GAP repeat protein [Phycisphaerae bacterium]
MRRKTNLYIFAVIWCLPVCVIAAEAWMPEWAKWVASDGIAGDAFGSSVSISGDYAIAGAANDDDNGNESGSAYVFSRVRCPASDLNGDCFIDFKDLAILSGEWLEGF